VTQQQLFVMPLDQLAQDIHNEHTEAKTRSPTSPAHALRAGELLTQAKRQILRWMWAHWLKSKCHIPCEAARKYLRLAARQGASGAKL
jgi:hypothetical protein